MTSVAQDLMASFGAELARSDGIAESEFIFLGVSSGKVGREMRMLA